MKKMTLSAVAQRLLSPKVLRQLCGMLLLTAGTTQACADVMMRITVDPGGAKQRVYNIADDTDGVIESPSDPAADQDGDPGSMLVLGSFFDATNTQIFDSNILSLTTSSSTDPFDFDLLADMFSFDAGRFLVEVSLTNLDPTNFTMGGTYFADIGGTAGSSVPGMAVSYTSGIDLANQPFVISQTIPPYSYDSTGTSGISNFSNTSSFDFGTPLSLFSMSARYEFTASAALQDLGFDSFNEARVTVPEPGTLSVAAFASLALPAVRRYRRFGKKRIAN